MLGGVRVCYDSVKGSIYMAKLDQDEGGGSVIYLRSLSNPIATSVSSTTREFWINGVCHRQQGGVRGGRGG